jgi:hypothetical protein
MKVWASISSRDRPINRFPGSAIHYLWKFQSFAEAYDKP